jgi:hypothetical protein
MLKIEFGVRPEFVIELALCAFALFHLHELLGEVSEGKFAWGFGYGFAAF